MKLSKIRELHKQFFSERNHQHLGSFSVVPEDEQGPLYTTAGMHPLVDYLKGDKIHPDGNRLASCQKVVRTTDIDEVGDDSHLTFFEMIGNWSIGDYGKEETLQMSFEFLHLIEGLPLQNLWVTVFEGGDEAPRDNVAASIWQSLGVSPDRIVYLPKKDNWWSMGDTGLCGPCSEMFIDTQPEKPVVPGSCLGDDPEDRFLEIGNNVFMDYFREECGQLTKLPKANIDVGLGLERLAVISENQLSVYGLEEFQQALNILTGYNSEIDPDGNQRSWRIVVEHCRALLGILGDSTPTFPKNTGRGYIVRQLVRRMGLECQNLSVPNEAVSEIIYMFSKEYEEAYPEFVTNIGRVQKLVESELVSFKKILDRASNKLDNIIRKKKGEGLTAHEVFDLKQAHGVPYEVTVKLAEERNVSVSLDGIESLVEEHKQTSKA